MSYFKCKLVFLHLNEAESNNHTTVIFSKVAAEEKKNVPDDIFSTENGKISENTGSSQNVKPQCK